MYILDLLNTLKDKGIYVSVNKDGKLSLKASGGILAKEADIVGQIKERKDEIINYLKGIQVKNTDFSVPRAEKKEYYPLSASQRGLYYSFVEDKNRLNYNLPIVLKINGNYDKDKIGEILNKVIERHHILRSRIVIVNSIPCQRIVDSLLTLEESDDRDRTIEDAAQQFFRPFDLENDLLIKARISKAKGGNFLLINMHHIITDGYSMDIFLKEFTQLYSLKKLGGEGCQYTDFTEWQNRPVFEKRIATQKQFWDNEFSGTLPVLGLPTDYKRTGHREYTGARYYFKLPQEKAGRLKKMASKEGCTLYTLLLSSFYLLLNKITNEDDIIIGTPFSGRTDGSFNKSIGMYINTLPVRIKINEGLSFKDFLNLVNQKVTNIIDNQNYPLERLVREKVSYREKNRSPFFDVIFVTQEFKKSDIELSDISLTPVTYDIKVSHFDLTLQASENQTEIEFVFGYDTNLYKKGTIENFAKYYLNLIENTYENATKKIEEITLLSKKEEHQVLFDFNEGTGQPTLNGSICDIFNEQIKKYPNNIALKLNDQHVTYKELDLLSNQYSNYLKSIGVTKGSVVGMILDRTVEQIASILGVLKAGGIYLPISHNNPPSRILEMLNDANANHVILENELLGKFRFSKLMGLKENILTPYKTGPREQIKNLDELPIPDRSLIDFDRYSKRIGQGMVLNNITLQATRGCPYSCTYCCRIMPTRLNVRSSESLFDEVRLFNDMGIKRFVFIDDIFNLDKKNSSRFLELLIKHNMDVQLLFPSGLRGDILDKEFIDLLVGAGAIAFPLSLETASERLQKYMKKNLRLDRFRDNIEYIIQKYPQVILELHTMHGFPTETKEEVAMTYDFVTSLKYVHFPYIHILKIHAGTEMERQAIEAGISKKDIENSRDLQYHEISDILPFDKNFTLSYQARLFNEYFMQKERLLKVLPYQMKVLTEKELIMKYDSYLPEKITSFARLLKFLNITKEELGGVSFVEEDKFVVENINHKIRQAFKPVKAKPDALKVLMLDLSQDISDDSSVYNVVEQPLGLMYLLSYLNKKLKDNIQGRILKSGVDYHTFGQLNALLNELHPDVIGVRSLSHYKEITHETIARIRNWGIKAPIIIGGPYSTSEHSTILQDRNIDIAVVGEGELTFEEIICEMIKNDKKLPGDEVLKGINGIAFVPQEEKNISKQTRYLLLADDLHKNIKAFNNSANTTKVNSHDLAYLIYTSGSTGLPKGSLIKHESVPRISANTNFVNITADDVILQLSDTAFDGSVFDIFGSLLNGAKLVRIEEEKIKNIGELAEYIDKNNITIMFLTTALFNTLADHKIEAFRNIKKILFGGERVSVKHVSKVFDYLGPGRLVHMYGPTEATVYATAFPIDNIDKQAETIPIGTPVTGTRAYILDRNCRPVPIGVPGELHIGGYGLSKGYLNNAGLTAEKFIKTPFANDNILYGTGDIAKWDPDGNIIYIDRKDTQVKLRGFRIELGEIEQQLVWYPGIQKAYIRLLSESETNKYLCAYLIGEKNISDTAIRKYLLDKLPDYMIPRYYVFLDEFPLNNNGKIDKQALPRPNLVMKKGGHVTYRNKIERELVKIWAEILEIDKSLIGTGSDFFELGGHSLKATILIAKIQERFNYKISLKELFEKPNIGEIAKIIKINNTNSSIPKAEKREYYPLSASQRGLYYSYAEDPNRLNYNVPIILKIQGDYDKEKIGQILNKVIKRHHILRSRIVIVNSIPCQRIVDCLLALEESDDRDRTIEDAAKPFFSPFDLENDLLIRARITKAKEGDFLLINMHHIVTDGYSMEIFLKEFTQLYSLKELGKLAYQYADFAIWQNTETFKNKVASQKQFWDKEFPGTMPELNLPTDYTRTIDKEYAGARHHFGLPQEKTRGLNKLAMEEGCTLYSLLLSSFYILLNKITNEDDIVIGTPFSGRTDVSFNKSIGMYINTLPVRIKMREELSFKEFLKQVKQKVTDIIDNQNYPLEHLVKGKVSHRKKAGNPLFDVVFVQQEHTANIIEFSDISLSPVTYDTKVSHFDITLQASDTPAGIEFTFGYDTHLFKKDTIENFAQLYLNLIEKISEDQYIKLKDISLLDEKCRGQVLFDFNKADGSVSLNGSICDVFYGQAKQHPHSIAVKLNDQHFTYKELDLLSNQYSNYLRNMGVTKGSVAGIIMDRTLEQIAAILGILKAGGIYLPISHNNPSSRILEILNDANADNVIIESKFLDKFRFSKLIRLKENVLAPYKTGPREQIKNLDEMPIPDRSLIDFDRYSKRIGQGMVLNNITLQATRGCPYSCTYCCRIMPTKLNVRSAESLFDEVRLFNDMGIKRYVFIDDIFNLHKKNSSRFLELLIKHNLDVQLLFPSGLRGDILDKEFIDLLVGAGAIAFPLSLETASERLQKYMKKNLKLDRFRDNMEYIIQKYPQVILELSTMHGFPTETKEEVSMTYDFITSLKYVHFPYIHILKIHAGTEMERQAIEAGISKKDIENSRNMQYHEIPDILPFDKNFTLNYQARLFNEYFMLKERLLKVLPYQMKVLTEKELIMKYDSYLPEKITSFSQLLKFLNITKEELGGASFAEEDKFVVENINHKIRQAFKPVKAKPNALRILMLDLSQDISDDSSVYNVVEQPLGLMYLLSYLNKKLKGDIQGSILKSGVDYNTFGQLNDLIYKFSPDIIGVRSLSHYKEITHETIARIRNWGIKAPIIIGGPYSTSEHSTILQDRNIDIAVVGEGELTFEDIINEMIKNDKKLPDDEVLKGINGIAFVPREMKNISRKARGLLLVDSLNKNIQLFSKDPIGTKADGKDLAYLIYTSGSSGVPKGSLIKHESVPRISVNTNFVKITADDVILQLSDTAFDGSVFDIFGSLLNGAKLIRIDEEKIKNIEELAGYIDKNNITIMFLTTALFNTLADHKIEAFRNIKKILFGGERVSVKHVSKVFNYLGPGRLVHMYGPTEATVYATAFPIDNIDKQAETIPIGTPVSATSVFILDRNFRPVPIGVPGEIYIGGKGLSKGYLNNARLTAEKFIKNPFAPNDILYATGDIAKWEPNGNIIYIDRKDTQVKLRGFRIELGEIEQQLIQYPGIQGAHVMLINKNEGNKYLCAYLIGEKNSSEATIRRYLLDRLPDYMIPAHYVFLDEFPLNNNGKIDSRALPEPNVAITKGFVSYRDDIEKALVDIWAEILEIDKSLISIGSDFFELGGHSLRATILIAKIQEQFNYRISLKELFEKPNISEIAKIIKKESSVSTQNLLETTKKEYYPLSPAQKRLYFLYCVDANSTAYNIPIAVEIDGKIEADRFESVIKQIISRHESLRTSFIYKNDLLVQKIHASVSFNLTKEVLREKKTFDEVIEDFVGPFDLSTAPLLRASLIETGSDKHLFIVDMHHIISDGTSIKIFMEEFMSLYKNEIPDPPKIQYSTYSEWCNSSNHLNALAGQKKFWATQFKEEIIHLDLPFDFHRPKITRYEGDEVRFVLNTGITDQIKEFTKENNVTLFMLLLAIYNILLSKLSNQDEIIIGTPIAGRRRADIQRTLGMFVNTLALKNYPKNDLNFLEFLGNLKRNTIEAFDNQDYQFEDLVELVVKERNMDRNPIFSSMFGLVNIDFMDFRLPDLETNIYQQKNKTSKFDISLFAYENNGQIDLTLGYSVHLFRKETIVRFKHYFINILNAVLDNGDIKISEIDILNNEEKNRINVEFNRGKVNYPVNKLIHNYFEKQTGKTPQRVAIKTKTKNYTYEELGNCADLLANLLMDKGIRPNTLVPLIVERSAEMIIGILGILKAGGAYLPMTPGYPKERVEYILNDSSAKIIVSTKGLINPKETEREIIYIDDMSNIPVVEKKELPTPSSLAYAIYTSGSSGVPKGVLIDHQSVLNILLYLQKEFPFQEKDVFLLKTSFMFDVSVTELFGWFFTGGTISVLDKNNENDPDKIIGHIEANQITHINFVPSMFEAFVDHLNKDNIHKISTLKYIFLAGEALMPELVAKFESLKTGIRIENIYGPTEATIYASKFSIKDWDKGPEMPIGVPVHNTTLSILSEYGGMQPIGVPGELCVSGDGLARGYINNPEQTHESFTMTTSGKRLYKTGDLVRWREDGNISYLGRIDNQIKIRGNRIEPGEIEKVLLRHEKIKRCIVVPYKHKNMQTNLCAYFVAEYTIGISMLKSYLFNILPAYMIPGYFVQLEEIPLLPSGKINRRALPNPRSELYKNAEIIAPVTQTEEKVVDILKQILSVEQISVESNFFDIGGNSINAIQYIRKINDILETDLSVIAVFSYPTVRILSKHIDEKDNVQAMDMKSRKKNFQRGKELQNKKRIRNIQ